MDNNLNPNIDADNSGENFNIDEDINSQAAQTAPPDPTAAAPQRQTNGYGNGGDNDDDDDDGGNDGKKKKLSDYFSLKKIASDAKTWWTNTSPAMKALIFGAIAFVILAIIIIVIIVNSGNTIVAYSGLDPQEAAEILTILKSNKIYYDYNSVLGTIAVKEKDAANIVMALAQEGYPRTGYNWSPTQSTGVFQTDADKLREEKENLRKLLETAINTLDGVESSLVIPNIADNRNNVLASEQEVSSVTATIHMKPGQKLSNKAVAGIQTLLLGSIPNIAPENISIHDSTGAVLNAVEEETVVDSFTLHEMKKKAENDYEADLTAKAMHALAPFFGVDGVTVSPRVVMNFDKWIEEAERYEGANTDPDTDEVKGIVVGQATESSLGHTTDSGVIGSEVGTALNIDDPGSYETPLDTEEGYYYDDKNWTTEYVVDQINKRLEHETPEITAVTISVSINTREELDPDVEEKLIGIVAAATGISDIAYRLSGAQNEGVVDVEFLKNFITVLGMPFYAPEVLDESGQPGFSLFQVILMGIILLLLVAVIILIVIMILGKKKQKRIAEEETVSAAAIEHGEMEELDMADAMQIMEERQEEEKEPEMPPESRERMLKTQIKTFTDHNTEIAAQLIRTMLKEEAPPNGR